MQSQSSPPSVFFEKSKVQSDVNHEKSLAALGIVLNIKTGQLFYKPDFKPMALSCECVIVRHGETFGNCGQITAEGKIDLALVASGTKKTEQRIFQGNVDTEINQLTALGKFQAEAAAIHLEEALLKNNWRPDIILHSPLSRAKETGEPFVKRNNFTDIYKPYAGIGEMSFGSLENIRVCDRPEKDSCHSFYQQQNALMKNIDMGSENPTEIFCDVLQRAHRTLLDLNDKYPNNKIILFSHSMFGAACAILLGKGQIIENGTCLAFDGKRTNGESYTMPHATPFYLNIVPPKIGISPTQGSVT